MGLPVSLEAKSNIAVTAYRPLLLIAYQPRLFLLNAIILLTKYFSQVKNLTFNPLFTLNLQIVN